MQLDRNLCKAEVAADLLVGRAGGEPQQHLLLARRQTVQAAPRRRRRWRFGPRDLQKYRQERKCRRQRSSTAPRQRGRAPWFWAENRGRRRAPLRSRPRRSPAPTSAPPACAERRRQTRRLVGDDRIPCPGLLAEPRQGAPLARYLRGSALLMLQGKDRDRACRHRHHRRPSRASRLSRDAAAPRRIPCPPSTRHKRR
jgi:hypothetical protein